MNFAIIKNCHIGTLTEGKYLEGWCLLGIELTREGGVYQEGTQ
jgi:hypothetical protein